ncbi:hypothetical protein Tco_0169486, partial [Tanacetum coccineum]
FPTPKGIATLVTQATIIAECRLREGKQILTEKQPKIHEARQPDEGADLTEQILVNLSLKKAGDDGLVAECEEDKGGKRRNIQMGAVIAKVMSRARKEKK